MPAESENIDRGRIKRIYNPIFLGQASGPEARQVVLEWFGLTDTHGGIVAAHQFLDDFSRGIVQLFVLSAHGFVRLPGFALKDQ